MIFSILIVFFTFVFAQIVLAQIPLPPAETTFLVQPLIPTPDQEGNILWLDAYLDHLDINWNVSHCANFSEEGECTRPIFAPINVNCYLNCPCFTAENASELATCCSVYSSQNCSYSGLSGWGGCPINAPKYEFVNENGVVCGFYNPADPNETLYVIDGKLPSRSFWAAFFDAIPPSGVTITIGEPFELPVRIRNLGLLEDNYTVKTELVNPADSLYVTIEKDTIVTDSASYKDIVEARPKITFRVAKDSVGIRISVKSNIEPKHFSIECNDPSTDCPPYGLAVCGGDDGCWEEITLALSSKAASLPGLDFFAIIQLMTLATAVLILIRKFK
jgi:hypothetical protein